MHKNNVNHFSLYSLTQQPLCLGLENLEEKGRQGKIFTSNEYSLYFSQEKVTLFNLDKT